MSNALRARRDPVSRRPTNVTLPETLVEEARALKVGVSQACEQGLEHAVKQQHDRAWLEENRAALDAWNDYIERNGIPLLEYRQF